MTTYTATYSPDDNKLRLYASSRLDAETYARVKAHGFKWAPKQELFVAPTWSPAREDLLIDLAGEIGDEDTSLVDRAEERAERFEEYSDKRMSDANAAHKAVAAIADNIPFGQPILVGHHSEKHARRDAEKIENGMRKAVKMWRTSQYWTSRAAGAIAHAKYKELPAVRHRRIKTIEADKRKSERSKADAEKWLALWTACANEPDAEKQKAFALKIANQCWLHLPRKEGDKPDFNQQPTAYDALSNSYPSLYAPRTVAEVLERALKVYPRSIAHCDRWLEHYDNRLAYERAMLAEQIGVDTGSANPMGERFAFVVGGKVQTSRNRDGEWLTIIRVNRTGGAVSSLTTTAPGNVTWTRVWKYGVETIQAYEPPSQAEAEKAKAATKLPPICNYPGDGIAEMTKAEFEKISKDYRGYKVNKATETTGAHRTRHALGVFVPAAKGDDNKRHSYIRVFLTDAKRVDPPNLSPKPEPTDAAEFVAEFVAPPAAEPDAMASTLQAVAEAMEEPETSTPPLAADFAEPSPTIDFEAMARSLKQGVQVVTAPQLFPTPSELAQEVADLAEIRPGDRVLEPSAGTGALLGALGCRMFGHNPESGAVVAVEINSNLARRLSEQFPLTTVINADFLDMAGATPDAKFDRIVMNPPFENGADIRHIEHARKLLKPGGRIVAICANGPRQRDRLKPIASEWRDLPPGSFKSSGTNVNAALLVIDG